MVAGELIEEATGKSSLYVPGFVLPGVRQGFDPQPDPPADIEAAVRCPEARAREGSAGILPASVD